jgi:glycosyltransferase involved in cell wall biosynthesis
MTNVTLRKKILFVMPGIPYPLRAHGVSIRYLPLLERFAAAHDIDLVMICDGQGEGAAAQNDDGHYTAELGKFCSRMLVIRRDPSNKPSIIGRVAHKLLTHLPGRVPHEFSTYDIRSGVAQIAAFMHGQRYAAVVWVTLRYCDWLMDLERAGLIPRLILDMVDSNYLALCRATEGRAHSASALRRTRLWESNVINMADEACYISPVDAAAVPAELINKQRHVIPNGVFTEGYHTAKRPEVASPSIGFLGNMSYQPNIEAALYLHRDVFVPLKARIPGLTLWIIGRAPVEAIKALTAQEGVFVTGEVDDIWPYVNAVDVFALPLMSGQGQQNKIMDAMLAAKPVVTSEIGNGGIGGRSGIDLLICESSVDWQHRLEELLVDQTKREALGMRGRQFVLERFDWNAIYGRFSSLIIDADTGARTGASSPLP